MTLRDIVTAGVAALSLLGIVYISVRLGRRLLARAAAGIHVDLPKRIQPSHWQTIIDRLVPQAIRLGRDERRRLLQLTDLCIQQVPIEGCGGLVVTEEMRVTIAAGASLLLVNLPYPRFMKLRRVLVYPDTYLPDRLVSPYHQGPLGVPGPTAGEAWPGGVVVLTWANVVRDAQSGDRSVILHEFAHLLDGEDGRGNGIPLLEPPNSDREWEAVFGPAFAELQNTLLQPEEPALHPYAATNRAEYFAVATEAFFTTPELLGERLPLVYEQLRLFYRQDPRAASASSPGPR